MSAGRRDSAVTTYLNFDNQVMAQSATPEAWLETTAAGQTLTGVSGPEQLADQYGGAPTLIAGTGDTTFDILDPNTTIVAAAGAVNTVNAWCDFTLPVNVQNLVIENPELTGVANASGDLIVAMGRDDTLVGGAGDDVLVDGGAGGDYFDVGVGGGHDVIYGFQASGASHDTLVLTGTDFTSFADIQSHMTQVGADTLLTLSPNDAVLLRNTTLSSLTAQDFGLPLAALATATPSFDDEFNTLSLYDSSTGQGVWKTQYSFGAQTGDGAWGSRTLTSNNEQELYVDPSLTGTGSTPLGLDPFSIADGVLTITASKTPAADSSLLWGYQYTSGLLTTQTSFAQLYGYFEIRAELPSGQGVWPAFWMVPTNGSSPQELDVFEQVGGAQLYQTAHYAGADGTATSTSFSTYDPTNSTGFHTYGLLWTPTTLTWYEDGKEVAQMATPADMNTPMYMLADLAIGGTWPGSPSADFSSAQYEIDYIRAYSLASLGLGSVAPTTAAATYDAHSGGVLTVDAAQGVLAGDIDNNGETLTAALAANGGPAHGTLTLNADGSFTYVSTAGYTGDDSFTYVASDSLSSSAATTVNIDITGGVATGAATVASTATATTPVTPPLYDFEGHGVSDLLIQNSNGAVVVGEVSGGQLSYTQVAALGPEWTFHGAGDFLGDGDTSFLIENTAGAVVIGDVSGGQTSYTQVSALGPEWSFRGAGDFLGDGRTDFLIESTSGAVVVGEVGSNGQASYTQVSALGSEWKVVGTGDFNGDGMSDFLIQNTAGAVVVGEVGSNGQASYTQVTALGSDWKFEGAGDFLGDGKSEFLIENSAGVVDIGEVFGQQIHFTQIAALGPEWSFQGTGDYLGEGHDQFVIQNTNGAVVVGDYVNGQIQYTTVGGLGQTWLFH